MNFLILINFVLLFQVVLSNRISVNEILHPECGKGTDTPTDKRIFGGSISKKGDWGWHVMLRKRFNPKGFCGGSLITNQWILTAAHCVYGEANPYLYYIDAGMQNRFIPDPWTKMNLSVSKIIVNTKFNWNTIQDDIALIKLQNALQIDTVNHTITPVCLGLDNNYYHNNRTAYSTGFGVINHENKNSDVLREIAIPLVSDLECISYNSQYDYSIDPITQVCAGIVRGNKSASDNDSGGPLVVRGEDKRWRLVGIASWGFGGKGNIGFYTRINGFADWIIQNILSN